MKTYAIRWAVLVSVVVTLAACGGGGGGGEIATMAAPTTTPVTTTPTPPPQTLVRAALPTLVQDIEPAGGRIDLRSRNYFPLGNEDTLTYDKTKGSTVIAGAVKRTTSALPTRDPMVFEVDEGVRTDFTYRRTATGILAIDPLGSDAPAAVRALVGNVLEYPEPFYAAGAVRTTVRQGGFGADLDGDGIQESFRLEIKQLLVGLETLPLPVGTAEMAHFTTTATFTISPSRQSSEVSTVITTENSWFAPGIGLVRANYVSTRPDGTVEEPFYSIAVASGKVDGDTLFTAIPGVSSSIKLNLTHNALVFDAARNRYYASVASTVVGRGNTIATIEPTTGEIAYSAPVGSGPSAMAISADGKALFVGVNGTRDVVKLRLPDMAEMSRTRLPVEARRGTTVADKIAVSPTEPDVIAVSTVTDTGSPDYGSLVLVRNGVVQPRTTSFFTCVNLIVFDPSGQLIYGFCNRTSEYSLRRIQVLADGVVEEQAFLSDAATRFEVRELDLSAQGLVLDSAIYRPSDFSLLGRVTSPIGLCRAHSVSNRLVCLADVPRFGNGLLAVVDASTFAVLSSPRYGGTADASPNQLVAGPVGQVALRYRGDAIGETAATLRLFNHLNLR